MLCGAVRRRAVIVMAACLYAPCVFANDPASTLAEKFAAEGEQSQAAKREAERKAEAQQKEEAARRAEELRKSIEAKERAAAERKQGSRKTADAAKRPPGERTDDPIAEQLRKADEEAEMLARARREAEDLQAAEEARILVEQEAAAQRAKAELEASRAAERARVEAEARARADQAAERERAAVLRAEEVRRLAEKLKKVRQIREARLAAQAHREASRLAVASDPVPDSSPAPDQERLSTAAPPAADPAPVASVQPARSDDPSDDPDEVQSFPDDTVMEREASAGAGSVVSESQTERTMVPAAGYSDPPTQHADWRGTRVTVLLVMVPGDRGIRRHKKVADPVLCTLDGCYVSTGATTAARFMPGRQALSIRNTWGARAGACRDSLGCVFRNVDLGEIPGYLQPVDLRIIKHDRRRGQVITSESDCGFEARRLSCSRGIYADDYTMWVLSEDLADAAGPDALERAVASGLNGSRSAEVAPRYRR